MNTVNINENNEKLVVEILPNSKDSQLIYALFTFLLMSLFLGILYYIINRFNNSVVFIVGPLEVFLGILIAVLSISLLVRPFLWSLKGKEVIEIENNNFFYYRDMFIYKEGKKKLNFQNIDLVFTRDVIEETQEIDLNENIMDDISFVDDEVLIGFQLDNDNIISTHLPISKTRLIDIKNAIDNFN